MKTKTKELMRETFGGDWDSNSRAGKLAEHIEAEEKKMDFAKAMLRDIALLAYDHPGILGLAQETLKELAR